MGTLFDWITDWIKQGLIDAVTSQFTTMFESVNTQVKDVAVQVGQTPESWNPGVFSMIKTLSETVVIPIAGVILTFIACYELISMIVERNNMHDFEPSKIVQWVFKTAIATIVLTNCFPIVMGIFEIAQHVINESATVINGTLDLQAQLTDLQTQLEAMSMWELIGLWLEMNIINLCLSALGIFVFVVTWGRIIEIYMMVSLAPIPLSTMGNSEWRSLGNNYLKSLFAVGFQGFLIMVCLAIYAALIQSITSAANIHAAIWGTVGYTVLLCFAMMKTGGLAKSIFGAH